MQSFGGVPRKDLVWRRARLGAAAFAGYRVAIVGGTNGIGNALARGMARHGAQVFTVGRTNRDHGVPGIQFIQADLQFMKDARRVARTWPAESFDLLLMTAGVMAGRERVETAEGIEHDLAVSYLSRFVMLRETAPRLGSNRPIDHKFKPRVFIWGFPGTNQTGNVDDLNSERSYNFMTAHSNTVVGNEALVLDGASRYPHLNVYGVNPGLTRTGIRSAVLKQGSIGERVVESIIGMLFPNVDEYAEMTLPLLVAPESETHSGAMFGRKGDAIEPSSSLMSGDKREVVLVESDRIAAAALSAELAPA